ncbi:MAG: VOC family protein [Chloroflexi bacterium]|nr:VOC family protein [Chloroflexota bacterium]
MGVQSINHTGIVVADLEKMVAFYRDVLGLQVKQVLERREGPMHSKLVYLGMESGHWIEFTHRYDQPPRPGHLARDQEGATHLCFLVKDLDRFHREASAKGLAFVITPTVRQDEVRGTRKIAYGHDPEGNWLEFIEFLAPAPSGWRGDALDASRGRS